MEQLERPDAATWDERRLWFEEKEAAFARGGAETLSEQACALMIDLQATFCAGVWSAVVILAAAIVDLQAGEGGRGLAGLDKTLRRLAIELASQTVVWVEGEHLPAKISLAAGAPPEIALVR